MPESEAVPSDVLETVHAGWWRRLGVPLTFWAVAFFSAALATGAGRPDIAQWAAIGPGGVGLLYAFALWRRRAVIRQESIEIRNFLFTRRIRYDEVRALTYDARSYRFYLAIPIGRVAKVSMRTRRSRATFHAGFKRFDKHAPFIVERVIEAMVKQMRLSIDQGEHVRFGRRIALDRRHLSVRRRLFVTEKVPIDELKLEVADGDVILSTQSGWKLGVFALRSTPNLLALPQLLEELSAAQAQPVPTALREALHWTPPRD